MKILVSNIGSTSFKFRLFDMTGGREVERAAGGADRIGGSGGVLKWAPAGGDERRHDAAFADHGEAIRFVLDELTAGGVLDEPGDLDAVAFKAVMAGDWPSVCRVDDALLERMEYFDPVAPAHNPSYVAAMRMFRQALPETELVAALEPGFHSTLPARRRYYAVPPEWAEKYGVKRYGFHGASHRYIATRMGELMPEAARVISCHLGGSSSLCAIRDGASTATSMGLSPQSGLPQGTRAGDFDPFAFKLLADEAGMDADTVLDALGSQSGLAALSGCGADIREIRQAAGEGNERAQLTLDVYVTTIRDYLGAYLVELGGTDAIAFTGGIGQYNPWIRADVCRGLEFAGIRIDADRNEAVQADSRIDTADSDAAIWIVATNEELIVARQARELLAGGG